MELVVVSRTAVSIVGRGEDIPDDETAKLQYLKVIKIFPIEESEILV